MTGKWSWSHALFRSGNTICNRGGATGCLNSAWVQLRLPSAARLRPLTNFSSIGSWLKANPNLRAASWQRAAWIWPPLFWDLINFWRPPNETLSRSASHRRLGHHRDHSACPGAVDGIRSAKLRTEFARSIAGVTANQQSDSVAAEPSPDAAKHGVQPQSLEGGFAVERHGHVADPDHQSDESGPGHRVQRQFDDGGMVEGVPHILSRRHRDHDADSGCPAALAKLDVSVSGHPQGAGAGRAECAGGYRHAHQPHKCVPERNRQSGGFAGYQPAHRSFHQAAASDSKPYGGAIPCHRP